MAQRLRVRIHYDRASHLATLLTVALLVAVFFGYLAWGRMTAAAEERGAMQLAQERQSSASTQSWYAPAPRSYYLSRTTYTGAAAGAACAAGYHMAALWEIADPSGLRYNPTLGANRADSGNGPPTVTLGWVRTGYDSDASPTPGQANCNAWSSSDSSDYGSVIRLPENWSSAAQHVGVWTAALGSCDSATSVWCVADAPGQGVCEEPLHISCGEQVNGDTSTVPFYSHPSYSCSAWDESGPELIYAFNLAQGAFYTVTATLSNLSVDLDVFLLSLSGCDTGQCYSATSYGDWSLTQDYMASATYYIAVDGANGAAGDYTLDLTCQSGPGRRIFLPLVIKGG